MRIKKKIKLTSRKKQNWHSLKNDHRQFIRNNKLLKTQQRFKSEWHNAFTEEINKISFSSNDDKRKQSIDSIETYAYETNKDDLISKKEEIKCNNIIKQCKKWLTLLQNVTKENRKEHNLNQPQISIIRTEY